MNSKKPDPNYELVRQVEKAFTEAFETCICDPYNLLRLTKLSVKIASLTNERVYAINKRDKKEIEKILKELNEDAFG